MTDTTPGAAEVPAGPADAVALIDLLMGLVRTQVLHAVATLHIADHLADGAGTAEEVAGREGSDVRATYRLMRAAASLGVLSYEGERRFGLTGMGQLLRTGVPGSIRAFVLLQAGNPQWRPMGLLPEAVRQGTSQTEKALGSDIFGYLARPENAGEAAMFSEAMADVAHLVVRGAVAVIDVAGVSEVVDVGGADGQFVLALMADRRAMRGKVLDLPHAVESARREAEKRGLADRFSAVAGDFFESVPAADLYLLKAVLHDWDDERAIAILRNCRSAVRGGGRAVVVENVVGEVGRPGPAVLADMAMLGVTGGIERDLEEFDALFAASGWHRASTYPVGAGFFALELDAV